MSSLQEPDGIRREGIMRNFPDDRVTREEKLAELDAERERNTPVALAYVGAAITILLPIGRVALVWWSVAR
jgi:hypothetical protein